MYNLLSVLQDKSCGHLSGPTDRNESLLCDYCIRSGVWRGCYLLNPSRWDSQWLGCQPCDGTWQSWGRSAALLTLCSEHNLAIIPDSLQMLGSLTVFEEANSSGYHSHKGIGSTNSLKEPRSWFFPSLNPWFQVRPQPQSIPWSQPGEIVTQSPAKPYPTPDPEKLWDDEWGLFLKDSWFTIVY